MEEREMLEKMDALRSRFNVSYAEARSALESLNWDLIATIEYLESQRKGSGRSMIEELRVTGAELVETLKRLLHQGNINRIIVKDASGRELFNLPVTGVLALTALVPIVTAIGAVAVMAMDYQILVERR